MATKIKALYMTDKAQTLKTYINDFGEDVIKQLKESGVPVFAEYDGGRVERVTAEALRELRPAEPVGRAEHE